jgi:hypothetical protein
MRDSLPLQSCRSNDLYQIPLEKSKNGCDGKDRHYCHGQNIMPIGNEFSLKPGQCKLKSKIFFLVDYNEGPEKIVPPPQIKNLLFLHSFCYRD